ncbi:MAG: hypothetical protein ACTIKQ_09420 [Microbacterium sp.]
MHSTITCVYLTAVAKHNQQALIVIHRLLAAAAAAEQAPPLTDPDGNQVVLTGT